MLGRSYKIIYPDVPKLSFWNPKLPEIDVTLSKCSILHWYLILKEDLVDPVRYNLTYHQNLGYVACIVCRITIYTAKKEVFWVWN